MTLSRAAVDELLKSESRDDPRVLDLAVLVSLAGRIEPGLLRAIRLAFLPHADAGVEADLWFSRMIETRDSSAVTLVPQVAFALRELLAQRMTAAELAALGSLIAELHHGSPPALVSEERLALLSLHPAPENRARIEEELRRLQAALRGPQGDALAAWLTSAIRRFPSGVRLTPAAETLAQSVALRTGDQGVLQGVFRMAREGPSAALPDDFVTVGLRASPRGLELSIPPAQGALELPVPATSPPLVDVAWPTVDGWESQRYAIRGRLAPPVPAPLGVAWRISTLRGEQISVRPNLGRRKPVLEVVSGSAGSSVMQEIELQSKDLLWDVRFGPLSRPEPTHATLLTAQSAKELVSLYDALPARSRRFVLASLRGHVQAVEATDDAAQRAWIRIVADELDARLSDAGFGRELRSALLRRDQQLASSWLQQRHTTTRLGATLHPVGTAFAVFSEGAESVDLCLFDESGKEQRFLMSRDESSVWTMQVAGIGEGQRYGYRAKGPWEPKHGLRFNDAKLLLDPYALAIEGEVQWHEAVFGYHFDNPEGTLNRLDSAPWMPKSVVTAPEFNWEGDTPPRIPLQDTIIYEAHVKGLTMLHPELPEEIRGTYLGLAHPAVIAYLQQLGVTAIELMPVHEFVHANHLLERGFRNYWGYDSIGFFAPHYEYASRPGQQVAEFKQMVKALHAAGLEVILDVVYNHTAEGNHLGPTLSLKGLDNLAYYRTVQDQPQYYMDYTGTGNSLNLRHPQVLRLIMDSLRYWVTEMHVDGFRFDLAATLARELHDVDRLGSFFTAVQQDPIIGQVKLIAEPWDVGEGGYQVGNFPTQWSEWNGKYRDVVRDYWRGTDQTIDDFATRLTGSSDLYAASGRRPFASINFVAAHDGFTLRDLVSYNEKHNEANREENRDGADDNRSWNCGAEGSTDDPEVNVLRARQQRNFLGTLFLSLGVPMLQAGDECGRTQRGNNNGYCQDNEISWMDWRNRDEELLAFAREVIALRRAHPLFRRGQWFRGRSATGRGLADIGWFKPEGAQMIDEDWAGGIAKSIGMFLNGDEIPAMGAREEATVDDSFFAIFHAGWEPLRFVIPSELGNGWKVVLDTAEQSLDRLVRGGDSLVVSAYSLVLLQQRRLGVLPPE